MKDIQDQVWAYLHNELEPERKQLFEAALREDATLREKLDECRSLHRQMEQFGDDQLAEQLLSEWESEHPEEQQKRPPIRIIRFALPLAAAAAVIVFLSLPIHQGPIQWKPTVYGSPPQFRGEALTERTYNRKVLKQLNKDLQHSIESSLAQLSRPTEPWTLRIYLQELADGYLEVEVSGYRKNTTDQSGSWNETFHGVEHFKAGVDGFAKHIADNITKQDGP